MKLRYIPNMLSIARIVLAIVLIPLVRSMGWGMEAFIPFIVYCMAGLTDMVDGPLARRIPGAASKIGAELDSVADLTLAGVGIFVILPEMQIWEWFWLVAIGIFSFKIIIPTIAGLIKHKKVLLLHTLSNKAAAMLLFLCPIVYYFTGASEIINMYLVFLVAFFAWAITEETTINLLTIKPNANIKGIWKVKEENKKAMEENSKVAV
ncbi:MAG: CDP-alcohol phosphatidyltransferase family protein [Oscillospiraceae bacterium]|nr:CDP-alcohol phosphatidyltransferase family protein [Oscillospiraceae bacterium]